MGVSIQQWRLAIGSNSCFSLPSYKSSSTTSSLSSNTATLLTYSLIFFGIVNVLALSYMTRTLEPEPCSITVSASSSTSSLKRIGSKQMLWMALYFDQALPSSQSWLAVPDSTFDLRKWSPTFTTASACPLAPPPTTCPARWSPTRPPGSLTPLPRWLTTPLEVGPQSVASTAVIACPAAAPPGTKCQARWSTARPPWSPSPWFIWLTSLPKLGPPLPASSIARACPTAPPPTASQARWSTSSLTAWPSWSQAPWPLWSTSPPPKAQPTLNMSAGPSSEKIATNFLKYGTQVMATFLSRMITNFTSRYLHGNKKTSGIRIAHWNKGPGFLQNKLPEVKHIVQGLHPHILGLSEANL